MAHAKQGSTPTVMRPFVSLATIRQINTAVLYKQREPPKTKTVRAPHPNQAPDAERSHAKRLLDDGASYQEVGRTIGRYPSTIANWWPGFQWSHKQMGEASAMARRLNQIERLTLVEKV
jgi:hypothetical protein